MNKEDFIKILDSLASGLDPVSGERLPNENVSRKRKVIRSLQFAIDSIHENINYVSSENIFKMSYKEPIEANEHLRVKINLLYLAINYLKRLELIKSLIWTLENMILEEMYYWYSKYRIKAKNKDLKAFRRLFDNV